MTQTLALRIIAVLILAIGIWMLHRRFQRERDAKDRLYVWTVNLREESSRKTGEIRDLNKKIKELQRESLRYSMALSASEYVPGGSSRMYQITSLTYVPGRMNPHVIRSNSARDAAFQLTDWSDPAAHIKYWEIIGKLYSIERGSTSKIVDGYTIKVS